MLPRSGLLLAIGALVSALVLPAAVLARRYPIVKADASGTWIGTRGGLLHGAGELWKRYGPPSLPVAQVTDLELTGRFVWVATPAGLARLDKGSRRWEHFLAPPLPTAAVTAISADPSDPDHLWVGTRAGLAHYNVRTNSWEIIGQRQGLPDRRINDVLFRGRTVWIASEGGLSAYDTALRTLTTYGERDGLAGQRVLEIDEQGSDLWLTGDQGLSRMNLQRRTFSRFGVKEGLPAPRILSQTRMQTLTYLVTEGGLITYDLAADALGPFLYAQGLQGAAVRAVASAGGYVWFATSKGLLRFDPARKSWETYRVEDGLSSEDLSNLAVAGSSLLIFGAAGELDTYDYKKDEWYERGALLTGKAEGPASQPAVAAPASQAAGTADALAGQAVLQPAPFELTTSAELDTELKQSLGWGLGPDSAYEREGYWLVNTLRLGSGARWGSGRTVDFSGSVDYGDVSPLWVGESGTLSSFQRYEAHLRYLGAPGDPLREVLGSTQLRLESAAAPLLESTELEGGRVVVGAGPARRGGQLVGLQAAAGLRRGTPHRVVFRRPSVDALQIKRFTLTKPGLDGALSPTRYVIPSSVRAYLDGQELERNVDYFVDHENGVLWIKNTDLIHALRVLEVELEYEQIPRKNVGAVSLTDLLPRDGNIGQLQRAGQSRWARDEQALFDEINGGAEQFINRGWDKTLSQDLEWASAGIILRVHDMGSDENARSIFLARKLPDAKPVPGLEEVYLERQTASLTVKLVRGQFYIEVSIDQPAMEQEILSIAGWIVGKLAASGGTSADAFRDATLFTEATLALTDELALGVSYLGTRSVRDEEVARTHGARERLRDLFALQGRFNRQLSQSYRLSTRLQAAASSASEEGQQRVSGNGLAGEALVAGPEAMLRLTGQSYSQDQGGIGVGRQTEFCRTADGTCREPGTSRLRHQLGAQLTTQLPAWLPATLLWQRQIADLGRDYDIAPADRERIGVRDVALAQLGLDRGLWPKLSLGAGYLRREDALAERRQLRARGAVEADLGAGLLKGLELKRLYLRGLYELGKGPVDEHRADPSQERDRQELMHHLVGELRLAPTLTESAYTTLEYHALRSTLDDGGALTDQLTYWRLDAGAGSSIVPGVALRFDSTLWFGDDQPLPELDLASGLSPASRSQNADSRLSGVLDLFAGEWRRALGPLKLNAAYTYTEQSKSEAEKRPVSGRPQLREICDNGIDDDGDGAVDCLDPDCVMADACLIITGKLISHRAYGTLSWDTPGKVQIELFGDWRRSYSGQQVHRGDRLELRSFVTWRPIYPSPLTLRFDVLHETKRPEAYDGIAPLVEPRQTTFEPALEWRRRWSRRWWHLAKLAVSRSFYRDQPHIRTLEDVWAKEGDLERLSHDVWAVTPSFELRRRIDDEAGRWGLRPYLRGAYTYQRGSAVSSRLGEQICLPGDACLVDGSETSSQISLSPGLVWIHEEHLFVDLDLNLGYRDCQRAPGATLCTDRIVFSPHLIATLRY